MLLTVYEINNSLHQVLTMQGYGKEADLWSVGVIMFLLLCGKLPFDGDDHNEIIRSTIQVFFFILINEIYFVTLSLIFHAISHYSTFLSSLNFTFLLHQADLKVNPVVWGKLSEESKTLMTSLLNKVSFLYFI